MVSVKNQSPPVMIHMSDVAGKQLGRIKQNHLPREQKLRTSYTKIQETDTHSTSRGTRLLTVREAHKFDLVSNCMNR